MLSTSVELFIAPRYTFKVYVQMVSNISLLYLKDEAMSAHRKIAHVHLKSSRKYIHTHPSQCL